MPCFAPSEILDTAEASQFGQVAERWIAADYLRSVGRMMVYPASTTDFMDFSEGVGNVQLFGAFLKHHNPAMSLQDYATAVAGNFAAVADLATHDAPRRLEYYEIKPDSITGRAAGRSKLARLDGMMAGLRLPYHAGVQYSPNKRITLYSDTYLGARIKVYFHFHRPAPGLLVYEICVDGEWGKLSEELLVRLLAIILAILLARFLLRTSPGGSPLPAPALA